jgi:hypothetical protein
MVAYVSFIAATASLSSLYHSSSRLPKAFSTTSTCKVVTATVTQYATARPTTNAHGHGGPYYNPYNDVALPFVWPGKPSEGQIHAPSQPPTPYQYGGPARDKYDIPAWIPSGSNKLTSFLSKGQQCGNSQWGEIDCPHLPVKGLPGGLSPKFSAKPPYPTASGSAYYSGSSRLYANQSVFPYGSGNATGIYISASSASTSASSKYNGTATSTPSNSACPTMPSTGVTRTYDMHVAYQTIAPDGVTRNGLTVNGQFPGPLIEANWYVLPYRLVN